MGSTVSNALFFTRRSEVFETAYFIEKVNKFFDCFYVSNFTQGKHTRKPYQEPHHDSNDVHIKVKGHCKHTCFSMLLFM